MFHSPFLRINDFQSELYLGDVGYRDEVAADDLQPEADIFSEELMV